MSDEVFTRSVRGRNSAPEHASGRPPTGTRVVVAGTAGVSGIRPMSRLGERLLRSAKEARAIARGEIAPARVFVPDTIDVAAIRRKTGLSQERFARRFGLSVAALRDWEQKRRNPIPRPAPC